MHTPHNRIALVTGAGSGIGRATALALLADGWQVVFSGRRLAPLHEAIAAAADPFGDIAQRTLVVSADITDPAQIDALFAATVTRFGRLDLLFNNAGVFPPGMPLEDVSLAQWRSAVDTNLTGAFLCLQAAYRQMKNQSPQGGRIINNGSIAAVAPRPNSIAYAATKHAITGLTRSASLDGRAHHIAVGQIDIGNAATDMTSTISTAALQADGSRRPEPVMDVAHAANAVVHMANLPLDTNVLYLTVMATAMPYVGRG